MIDHKIINFTEHAKKQMLKRRISKDEVIITLNFPDHITKGSHSNESIAVKLFNKKRIRVIYISIPNEIRIITVTH